MLIIVNGMNPTVSVVGIAWSSGEGSSEKNCCWWLTFRQPQRTSSLELGE